MKSKVLLITALLASAVGPTFGQAANPMATPNATETFAIVNDGPNLTFRLKWDVYLPSTPGQYPAVLVIFGGRFMSGSRADVAQYADDLRNNGFVAIAIDHRTDKVPNAIGQQIPVYAPPANPNQPGDVKLAVTAARLGSTAAIQGWITGKVGAVGGSSGASHALWCAATGSLSTDKLDAAVLFSGAYQFDDAESLGWGGYPGCRLPTFCPDVSRYCQQIPPVCPSPSPAALAALKAGSPINQVKADVSPLFWVSNDGDVITPFQFTDLQNKIDSLGLDPNIYKGVWTQNVCAHSFDNWGTERTDVFNWLHLRLDPIP